MTSEFLELSADTAICRVTLQLLDDSGTVVKDAQGTKNTRGNEEDDVAKAEGGALGRALKTLGFTVPGGLDTEEPGDPTRGKRRTQDSGRDEQGRTQAQRMLEERRRQQQEGGEPGGAASQAQLKAIFALGREKGLTEPDLKARAFERFEVDHVNKLTRRQASQFIDELKGMREGAPA